MVEIPESPDVAERPFHMDPGARNHTCGRHLLLEKSILSLFELRGHVQPGSDLVTQIPNQKTLVGNNMLPFMEYVEEPGHLRNVIVRYPSWVRVRGVQQPP